MKHFSPDEYFDTSYSEFVVEKYVETKGYLYLVQDKAFPDFVKIGRTCDFEQRLSVYNRNKPYPTIHPICISRLFADVVTVETKVLDYLYKVTAPTTFRKEWFRSENTNLILTVMKAAENEFE